MKKLELLIDNYNIYFKKAFEKNITGNYVNKHILFNKTVDKLKEKIDFDKIGEMILKNPKGLMKKLREVSNWWEEEFDKYEYEVEDGINRVMVGAREDLADEKSAEEDEEYEPEDIDELELDPEILFNWWGEEWHHNVENKNWISKIVSKTIRESSVRRITLKDVMYRGLEGAVEDVYISPYKDYGFEVIEKIEEMINNLMNEENARKTIEWVFSPSDVLNIK